MLSNNLWNMLSKETSFLKGYIGKTYNLKKYGKCIVKNYTLSTQLELEDEKGKTFMVWFDDIKQELK